MSIFKLILSLAMTPSLLAMEPLKEKTATEETLTKEPLKKESLKKATLPSETDNSWDFLLKSTQSIEDITENIETKYKESIYNFNKSIKDIKKMGWYNFPTKTFYLREKDEYDPQDKYNPYYNKDDLIRFTYIFYNGSLITAQNILKNFNNVMKHNKELVENYRKKSTPIKEKNTKKQDDIIENIKEIHDLSNKYTQNKLYRGIMPTEGKYNQYRKDCFFKPKKYCKNKKKTDSSFIKDKFEELCLFNGLNDLKLCTKNPDPSILASINQDLESIKNDIKDIKQEIKGIYESYKNKEMDGW